jgi:hypothetical protein
MLAAAQDQRCSPKVHPSQPATSAASRSTWGEGRRFELHLSESDEHAAAAMSVLGQKGRVLSPLTDNLSELVGVKT